MTTYHLDPQPPPAPGVAESTWVRVIRNLHAPERGAARDTGGRRHPDEAAVWALLAQDGAKRDAFGVAKYGTPHQVDNKRDHASDAYQEALDGLCYAYAEADRVGFTPEATRLYGMALDLAHGWRAYLYARDGR